MLLLALHVQMHTTCYIYVVTCPELIHIFTGLCMYFELTYKSKKDSLIIALFTIIIITFASNDFKDNGIITEFPKSSLTRDQET